MSVSLSEHLIHNYTMSTYQPMAPFGQSSSPVVHGQHSYDSRSHGGAGPSTSSSGYDGRPPFMHVSDETAAMIAALQIKLNQKLGPEYISQRPGPGGGPKLTYVEGWKIINLANEVFGFNGWSSSIVSLTTDFVDYNEESRRYTVGVTAIVRITLRDGVFHEDTGYGMLENSKSKGAALDKCKKEAVTDGIKRALRNFGNLMGNCLYDKQYAQDVVKVKVPVVKFNPDDLHRRPEFQKPDTNPVQTKPPAVQNAAQAETKSAITPGAQGAQAPMYALPKHMQNTTVSKPPLQPNGAPNGATGLATPITTPVQRQHQQYTAQQANRATAMKPMAPVIPMNNPSSSSTVLPPQPQKQTMRQQPPAAPKVSEQRHVSFAAKMEVDGPSRCDESFADFSEDDAFLAAVDLEDGDFGPPIHYDGEQEEEEEDMFGDLETSLLAEKFPDRQGGQRLPQNPGHRQETTRAVPEQQHNAAQMQRRAPVAGPSNEQGQNQRLQVRSNQHQQPTVSRFEAIIKSSLEGMQDGAETKEPSSSSSSTLPEESNAPKKTTSSGGYNFPMDLQKNGLFSSNGQSSVSRKRTVESLQPVTTSAMKRPLHGMGLGQHQARMGQREMPGFSSYEDERNAKKPKR